MGTIAAKRTLSGRASSNPVWDEVQALAVADLALPPAPPPPQTDPEREQQIETEELMHALELAVQALPEPMQLLYRMELLKQEEGLSDSEVAARMGLGSRNTLMKQREQLYRALRQHLGQAAPA